MLFEDSGKGINIEFDDDLEAEETLLQTHTHALPTNLEEIVDGGIPVNQSIMQGGWVLTMGSLNHCPDSLQEGANLAES